MKLLLDEHFSPRIAAELRRRRHDVVAARGEPDLHGLSDAELLGHATAHRRALVTENVADFAELHRAAIVTGRRHFGVVFTSPRQFPRTTRAIGKLVRALDALLDAHRADTALLNQTWWLEVDAS
jgi:predicted nuclease of predicted toxin-antitoxin system